ncbi:MAG: TIM barrel protein [Alphaproteobacteria bacterium]|nr:TIM barrel protein [Alphaproteobacteria bacterium]
MLRLAANLDWLFQELPMERRFAAAAEAGFRGIELLRPYAHRAEDLERWRDASGLQCVLLNVPSGAPDKGEIGFAALPGRESEFRDGLARGLDYCEALNCPRLHVMAGVPAHDADREACAETYIANLRQAAEKAAARGVTVLIEPLNARDIPGYFLATNAQARLTIDMVEHANLRLQFDAYHTQISEGDLFRRFATFRPLIGHVQVADPPERHEPGKGEINYPNLLRLIEASDYAGWVSAEYRPSTADTRRSLAWGQAWGLKSA